MSSGVALQAGQVNTSTIAVCSAVALDRAIRSARRGECPVSVASERSWATCSVGGEAVFVVQDRECITLMMFTLNLGTVSSAPIVLV
jgi:hypothetical protein